MHINNMVWQMKGGTYFMLTLEFTITQHEQNVSGTLQGIDSWNYSFSDHKLYC